MEYAASDIRVYEKSMVVDEDGDYTWGAWIPGLTAQEAIETDHGRSVMLMCPGFDEITREPCGGRLAPAHMSEVIRARKQLLLADDRVSEARKKKIRELLNRPVQYFSHYPRGSKYASQVEQCDCKSKFMDDSGEKSDVWVKPPEYSSTLISNAAVSLGFLPEPNYPGTPYFGDFQAPTSRDKLEIIVTNPMSVPKANNEIVRRQAVLIHVKANIDAQLRSLDSYTDARCVEFYDAIKEGKPKASKIMAEAFRALQHEKQEELIGEFLVKNAAPYAQFVHARTNGIPLGNVCGVFMGALVAASRYERLGDVFNFWTSEAGDGAATLFQTLQETRRR